MKRYMAVASFDNLESAERFHRTLLSSGLDAEVIDPGETEKITFFIPKKVMYRVRVDPDQADQARHLLADSAAGLPGLFLCPQCQSSRVEYPQLTRKSSGLFAIFGLLTRVGALDPKFYCQDCHLTWEPGEEARIAAER